MQELKPKVVQAYLYVEDGTTTIRQKLYGPSLIAKNLTQLRP